MNQILSENYTESQEINTPREMDQNLTQDIREELAQSTKKSVIASDERIAKFAKMVDEKKNQPFTKTENEKLKKPSKASPEREKAFDEKEAAVEEQSKTIEEIVVDELNNKHAIVHTDQFYILTEKQNPTFGGVDFSLESRQSFLNTYENKVVTCSDEKTKKTKAKIWLEHPRRKEFNGIIFDPTSTKHTKGYYNLWRGFTMEPKAGDCSLFWNHVRDNICNKDPIAYKFVRKWVAKIFQHPDEVHTALVLQGSQGVGKNSFVEPLGKLFGSHYVLLSSMSELVSNFNYHLKNAVLIHANEALWGGDKKVIGTIKAMITESTCLIESKGKDRIMVKNFKHMILSSNEEWPVHLDHDDRRFYVLRVSEDHKEDNPYFAAIQNQLNDGGYEALLYDLLNEDLSGFNPRKIPDSSESFAIKIRSADSVHRYVFHALQEGSFDVGNNAPNGVWGSIAKDSVYVDFQVWCSKSGEVPCNKDIFCRRLRKVIPQITDRKLREADKRISSFDLPPLSQARQKFQEFYKAGDSIWNE